MHNTINRPKRVMFVSATHPYLENDSGSTVFGEEGRRGI